MQRIPHRPDAVRDHRDPKHEPTERTDGQPTTRFEPQADRKHREPKPRANRRHIQERVRQPRPDRELARVLRNRGITRLQPAADERPQQKPRQRNEPSRYENPSVHLAAPPRRQTLRVGALACTSS